MPILNAIKKKVESSLSFDNHKKTYSALLFEGAAKKPTGKTRRNPLTNILDIPNLWLLTIPPGSSRAVSGIAYDPINNDLFVAWGSGNQGWYWYRGVPMKVWMELTKASSKGRFLVDNIKENYQWELI